MVTTASYYSTVKRQSETATITVAGMLEDYGDMLGEDPLAGGVSEDLDRIDQRMDGWSGAIADVIELMDDMDDQMAEQDAGQSRLPSPGANPQGVLG